MANNIDAIKRGWHYNAVTGNLEAYNNGNEIFQYPYGTNYYVSKSGADTNSGKSWALSFLTISAAMTAAASVGSATTRRGGVKIYVAPGGYTEDIKTPLNADCPFGQLIAVNPTPGQSYGAVYVTAATAGVECFQVRARGWYISGFEFDALADAESVVLGGGTGTNASGTIIEDCLFVGQNQGLYGIDWRNELAGASNALCTIRRCGFYGFTSGTTAGKCLSCSDSGSDQPRFALIEDCWFGDSDNLIDMNPRGFKESTIRNCTFYTNGANQNPDEIIDNTGGNDTMVYGCKFPGTYTNAGGYVAGTNDNFAGNSAFDESGKAANGWTYANPA